MQRALTMIGLIAVTVLIAASATMNYLFATSLGRTVLEGQVLGVVSVAVDILKAVLAVFVAAGARDGRRAFVVIGSAAFLLFSMASMLAAAGFTAHARGAATGSRATLAARLQRAELDVVNLQAKLAAIPVRRAASIVEDAFNTAMLDRRWRQSKECTAATTAAQSEFCSGYFRIRAELTAAREMLRLEAEIVRHRAEIDRLTADGALALADPQAHLIAEMLGVSEDTVQRLLMTFVALVVEVSSGLGFYLATGHRSRPTITVSDTSRPLAPAGEKTHPSETSPSPIVVAAPIEPEQVRRRNRLRSPADEPAVRLGRSATISQMSAEKPTNQF